MDRHVHVRITAVANPFLPGHAQAAPIVRHQNQSLRQHTRLCTLGRAISALGDGALTVMEGHQDQYLKEHTRLGTPSRQSAQCTAA
jgi:hypothetical protein